MRDLIDLARLGWQHDKGGLFAVLSVPFIMWAAALLGEL